MIARTLFICCVIAGWGNLLAQCNLAINLNGATLICVDETPGSDEIILRIPFEGSDPNFMITITPLTMGAPTPEIGGNDPATENGGFISVSQLFENASYLISLMGDNCNFGSLTYSIPDGICGLLPVNLRWFSGRRLSSGEILLEWSTEGEQDADDFQLLRSTDGGRRFQTLTRLAAAGSTEVPQNYRYIDSEPVAGENYYMLEQVDMDGSSYRYGPVRLNVRKSIGDWRLFPNPAGSEVFLELPEDLEGSLELWSLMGQLLDRRSLIGQGLETFNLSGYPAGVYQLIIRDAGGQAEMRRLLHQPQ